MSIVIPSRPQLRVASDSHNPRQSSRQARLFDPTVKTQRQHRVRVCLTVSISDRSCTGGHTPLLTRFRPRIYCRCVRSRLAHASMSSRGHRTRCPATALCSIPTSPYHLADARFYECAAGSDSPPLSPAVPGSTRHRHRSRSQSTQMGPSPVPADQCHRPPMRLSAAGGVDGAKDTRLPAA